MANEFGFDPGTGTSGGALAVRAQGGLNKAEAFVHKHSTGPAIPITTAVMGLMFLPFAWPVALVLGGAAGLGGAKLANKHFTAKAGMNALGTASTATAPTGYQHLAAEPSRDLQAEAAQFFTDQPKLNATKKTVNMGKGYLFRIEKYPPAPERGLMTDHLGVTIYESIK